MSLVVFTILIRIAIFTKILKYLIPCNLRYDSINFFSLYLTKLSNTQASPAKKKNYKKCSTERSARYSTGRVQTELKICWRFC